MPDKYESLLGYEQGARRIHVHISDFETQDIGETYEHTHQAEEAIYFLEGEAEYTFGG